MSGQEKCDLLIQVTACLIEVTTWAGLTVHVDQLTNMRSSSYRMGNHCFTCFQIYLKFCTFLYY